MAARYNSNNQIIGNTYDADGNLLSDGTNTYTYDAEGRVTSISNASGTTQYIHNALGQVARTLNPANNFTYDYAYDPWGARELALWGCPACGYDAEEYITFGGRAVAGYNENNPRETEFFHYDGLGSMVMQTNQTGGVEEQQVFYPLGPVWLASGGDHAGMCLAGELGCNVRPIRSIASQIAAFRMNQFHTLPVARFSALSSVMPTSMPITSGLTQPVFGLKASVNP